MPTPAHRGRLRVTLLLAPGSASGAPLSSEDGTRTGRPGPFEGTTRSEARATTPEQVLGVVVLAIVLGWMVRTSRRANEKAAGSKTPGLGELVRRLVAFVIAGVGFLVVLGGIVAVVAVLYWLVANGWGSFTVPVPWSHPVVPSLGPVPWPTPGT